MAWFKNKTEQTLEFRLYRSQVDPVLAELEAALTDLGQADSRIADDLTRAEQNGDSIEDIGKSFLMKLGRCRDRIESVRGSMKTIVAPARLQKVHALYLRALDTCLESVSLRIEACCHIVEGNSVGAETVLLNVRAKTLEFKRQEENALEELQKALRQYG